MNIEQSVDKAVAEAYLNIIKNSRSVDELINVIKDYEKVVKAAIQFSQYNEFLKENTNIELKSKLRKKISND